MTWNLRGFELTDPPGLSCLGRGHLFADMHVEGVGCIGSWCLWCGGAAYGNDGGYIDEETNAALVPIEVRVQMLEDRTP